MITLEQTKRDGSSWGFDRNGTKVIEEFLVNVAHIHSGSSEA